MASIQSAILCAGVASVGIFALPCSAAVCSVPSASHPNIQSAVGDLACTEVVIAAGTYAEEVVIRRDLDVGGASGATTILEGQMVIEGAAIQVNVHDLKIDASAAPAAGCFADALLSRGGGLLRANGVVVVNGDGDACLLFRDGFESGNTTAWSGIVP